jgi:hypothetical protein
MLPSLPQIQSYRSISQDRRSLMTSDVSFQQEYSTHMDKLKYGALLPKSGVYFVPDDKIVVLLKIMRDMIKIYEQSSDYHIIGRFRELIVKYQNHEEQRLLHNMKVS